MKLTVAIKTADFPPASMTCSVETFRDVDRLGRKLSAYAKAAGRILPDLKGAAVEGITISADGSGSNKRARKRRAEVRPAAPEATA
jgi:hypothetical protein